MKKRGPHANWIVFRMIQRNISPFIRSYQSTLSNFVFLWLTNAWHRTKYGVVVDCAAIPAAILELMLAFLDEKKEKRNKKVNSLGSLMSSEKGMKRAEDREFPKFIEHFACTHKNRMDHPPTTESIRYAYFRFKCIISIHFSIEIRSLNGRNNVYEFIQSNECINELWHLFVGPIEWKIEWKRFEWCWVNHMELPL